MPRPLPACVPGLSSTLAAPALAPCSPQALLQRLESRAGGKGASAACCAGLLRRLFPRAPPGAAAERYPPRIFLCAYMVLAHPGELQPGTGFLLVVLRRAQSLFTGVHHPPCGA